MAVAEIDLTEFEAAAPAGTVCWFRKLTAEQQAKVTAARAAGHSFPTIARVVTAWGNKISSSSVGSHFNELHSCGS